MGLFSKILEKLGIGSAEAKTDASAAPTGTPSPGTATTPTAGAAPASRAIPLVDVESQMDALAKKNPQKLNWRTSIVDLMKLLDMDSSLAARKELATELGCPADYMGDSAKMNVWLHKTVMARIADNGGKVPADLLD